MSLGVAIAIHPQLTNTQGGDGEPSEFITNGNFASGANWTQGAGWVIGGGVASYSGSAAGLLSQDFGALTAPLIPGNSYDFSALLDNSSGQTFVVVLNDGVDSLTIYTGTDDGAISALGILADHAYTTITVQVTTDTGIATVSIDNISLTPA